MQFCIMLHAHNAHQTRKSPSGRIAIWGPCSLSKPPVCMGSLWAPASLIPSKHRRCDRQTDQELGKGAATDSSGQMRIVNA